MAVKGITPAAEAWVQHTQISNPIDLATIRRCIVEYTEPGKGVGSYLTYLVNRIWNAVKIFFGGRSTWQVARASIVVQWITKARELAKENKLNHFGSALFIMHAFDTAYFADNFLYLATNLNFKGTEDLKNVNYFDVQLAGLKAAASKMAEYDLLTNKEAAISKTMEAHFKNNPCDFVSN